MSTSLFQQNGTECNQWNITQLKRNFCFVWLEVTVGRFPQNCGHPFWPKVDFQAERFELLTIRSVQKGRE
uniref:Uncharacterized protein n=1 Tax=Romanomermis culicivorax TaxID=13658 RepID=A0A915L9I1_ROMCU